MENICYVNGEYFSLTRARISPRDLGFLRGYAVFDVMPIIKGKPFLFDQHWERLLLSASTLGLSVSMQKDAYTKIIDELLRKNPGGTSVRTVVSGGESESGIDRDGEETVCIFVEYPQPLSQELYAKGGKLTMVEYCRYLPRAKTTNHIITLMTQKQKEETGSIEVLFHQDGKIYEASTSNFFAVRDGVIFTPCEGVLWGETRNLVIRLSRKNGMKVQEEELFTQDIPNFDEAFITASSKDVVPIVEIDNVKINEGKVGPVTQEIMHLYQGYIDAL